MRKNRPHLIIIALSWLLAGFNMSASLLTPDAALNRLNNSVATRSPKFADLKYTCTFNLSDGEPGLYVFENNTQEGYAILSADDVAAPLLGYSDSGMFDKESISPEMKWWLEEYTRQIEYARINGAKTYRNPSTRADMASIAPMISTQWNQGVPYNEQTPEDNGRHCVTGCVATALAQVMKHWNYPETGTGVGECTVSLKDGTTRTERMMLNEQNFDWSNMIDIYDSNATQEQRSAVAYLMKACGYSVSMNYSTNESGAPVLYVATALANNFYYNPNLQYCQRSYFSATEWTDMIYEEIAAGRPVVYGGQSGSGGHCFVCDGYDSDGYFHFNWGWGGMSDGYFLLNALNPGALGTGANGGGYNFGQEIVRGIQPTEGKAYAPNFVQQGNMEAYASGLNISLNTGERGGWFNMDTKAIKIDVGAILEPIAPTTGETIYLDNKDVTNYTLQLGYGFTGISFNMPSSLADGTYRLTLCFRLSGTEEWTPVRCESDCYNYIDFTKKGLKLTIEENKMALPMIEDAEVLTPLYYGDIVKISLTVSNPNSKEITNYFCPALCSGDSPVMIAEGIPFNLAPGEKATKEFTCIFKLLSGKTDPTAETTYQLCFYDPTYDNTNDELHLYEGFSKDVTMKINSGEVDLTINDFSIKDYDTYPKDGRNFYNVTDPSSIPFSISFTNNAEYFAKPVNLFVFPYIPQQETVNSVAYEEFTPIALLAKGEETTLTMNLNFIAGEFGNSYFAMPCINDELIEEHILFFTLADETGGVEDIASDEIAIGYEKNSSMLFVKGEVSSLILSSMNGIVFDKTSEALSGSVNLGDLPTGLYIVKATSTDGTIKTQKIMK